MLPLSSWRGQPIKAKKKMRKCETPRHYMGVKNLSGAEQLALLNRAGDLVSEANNILCSAGLGVVRSDGHQGHQGALIYPINELRSEVLTALRIMGSLLFGGSRCGFLHGHSGLAIGSRTSTVVVL